MKKILITVSTFLLSLSTLQALDFNDKVISLIKNSLKEAVEENGYVYHKCEPFELGRTSVYQDAAEEAMFGKARKIYTVECTGDDYVYSYHIENNDPVSLRTERIETIINQKEFRDSFKSLKRKVNKINSDYMPVILDLILSKYSLPQIEDVKLVSKKTEGAGYVEDSNGKSVYRERLLLTIQLDLNSGTVKTALINLLVPNKHDNLNSKVVGTLGQSMGIVMMAVGGLTSEFAIGVPICTAGICMYNYATNEKTPSYFDAKITEIKTK